MTKRLRRSLEEFGERFNIIKVPERDICRCKVWFVGFYYPMSEKTSRVMKSVRIRGSDIILFILYYKKSLGKKAFSRQMDGISKSQSCAILVI